MLTCQRLSHGFEYIVKFMWQFFVIVHCTADANPRIEIRIAFDFLNCGTTPKFEQIMMRKLLHWLFKRIDQWSATLQSDDNDNYF